MKAYVIRINDNKTSETGTKNLIASSVAVNNPFEIKPFAAVTPDTVQQILQNEGVVWNWPHTGGSRCPHTNLRKHGYGGRDPKRRRSCGMSHYLLWKECVFLDQPILIFEHDAVFNTRLDPEPLIQSEYIVIGLNDPRGTTRKASTYHGIVENSKTDILPCPVIDNMEIPQGIAGNSAYMIKPVAARLLLAKVKQLGMWNNDAILCQQIIPNIGQTKTYYTKVQNLPSTTMG